MAAIILSGGKNKRLGTDKALLKVGFKTIIEREISVLSKIFTNIFIVTNCPEQYKHLKADLISDLIPGKGPLGGIYSGVKISDDEYNFVVSCDLPFLNAGLISHMKKISKNQDVVVPKYNGFFFLFLMLRLLFTKQREKGKVILWQSFLGLN